MTKKKEAALLRQPLEIFGLVSKLGD